MIAQQHERQNMLRIENTNDPQATYNPVTREQLISWRNMFEQSSVPMSRETAQDFERSGLPMGRVTELYGSSTVPPNMMAFS